MKNVKRYELRKLQSDFPQKKIQTSLKAANFIRQFYGDDIEVFESAFILLLDSSATTVGYAKISQGGTTGTTIDLKLVVKYSIDGLARGVIFAHNHPTGNLNFSDADIALSKRIKTGLELFDISLIDSIVLTKDGHSSMSDERIL